jgi:23S rRNA pseudouridine2605 synthase
MIQNHEKMNQIRIAKLISDRGHCSRRKAEELISLGIVFANGTKISSPSEKFSQDSEIIIDGKIIEIKQDAPKIWRYYKPVGLVTTHKDPQKRPTVFDNLPIKFEKKIISIGRLDINSEGLLLLTDSGEIARYFELPSSKIERSYKVRAFGRFNPKILKQIENGVEIEGIKYQSAKISCISSGNSNHWFEITLTEGKNREIRKIFSYFGLEVNKLIRISYGQYQLENLKPGEMVEASF